MKNLKNELNKKLAKGLMNIGETGATSYSLFFNWYEPKISYKLLTKNFNKNEKG